MFGFSPAKILFTALIVAAVWYGFKWLGRAQASQNKSSEDNPKSSPKSDNQVEDLVACPTCGDYVISNKKSGCGKEGCPYA